MVVTVQGYNKKNNKSKLLVASLASASALMLGDKTLVIQLIDNDMENVENILHHSTTSFYGDEEQSIFADDGIDSILRNVSTAKLSKGDFTTMSTPILSAENRLDVCGITKNTIFTHTILEDRKMEQVKTLIDNAKEVYQNIIILLPACKPEIVKAYNELEQIDKSIYCVRQGYTQKDEVYGKNPIYVITEFEKESVFSVKFSQDVYSEKGKKPVKVHKVSRNLYVADAALKGNLITFVRKNLDLLPTDVNYNWKTDIYNLAKVVFAGEEKQDDAIEELPSHRGFIGNLFGASKKAKAPAKKEEQPKKKVATPVEGAESDLEMIGGDALVAVEVPVVEEEEGFEEIMEEEPPAPVVRKKTAVNRTENTAFEPADVSKETAGEAAPEAEVQPRKKGALQK